MTQNFWQIQYVMYYNRCAFLIVWLYEMELQMILPKAMWILINILSEISRVPKLAAKAQSMQDFLLHIQCTVFGNHLQSEEFLALKWLSWNQ